MTERYLEQLDENPNDDNAQAMIEFYRDYKQRMMVMETTREWQTTNLEYDLRTTPWILAKVRDNEAYAQNLYAAMCNRDYLRLDVVPILTDSRWSCSWRHAGGIIADMRQDGDYIDWYCSGIGSKQSNGDYVGEGTVTPEIEADLLTLGWKPLPDNYV